MTTVSSKKRFRGVLVLVLALGVGYVAAVSAARYLDNQGRAFEEQTRRAKLNLSTVVAASKEVPTGTTLAAYQLKLIELPKDAVPRTALHTIEDVVGRVNSIRMLEDDLVLEGKLSPVGSASGLQSVIPEGRRAITVKANEVIGLAGFLSPGDYVDVIGAVEEHSGSGVVTKTVLQKIKVLTVGEEMERTPDGKQKAVSTVTLLVTPEEAERLVLVTSQGRIQLVMRSPGDQAENVSSLTTFDKLLGRPVVPSRPRKEHVAAPPPAPAVAPAPPPAPVILAPEPVPPPEPTPKITVEIFRGVKKEERQFETNDTTHAEPRVKP